MGATITTDAEINNNIHATSSFIDYHGTRICAPPEYFTKRCYNADGINVWSLGKKHAFTIQKFFPI